jgi:prolipoprotein diacylglyceryltransferase
MVNELGVLSVGVGYALLFVWAFRVLPHERWQFMASVPRRKGSDGQWVGTNLTYYGVFLATGVALAVAVVVVLMGALSIPLALVGMVSAILLACCVPAAKLVARTVEAQANTFTIGGAAFTGMLLAPWTVWLTDRVVGHALGVHIPILPVLAVLAIAYAFGESIGRLACISFGCCYGKPLSKMSRGLTKLFGTHHFAFSGATKKAAYEGGLEMVPVIPIQAVTAILFVCVGLVGLLLFLHGHMLAAFLATWVSTQTWRVVSEFFRADYRGKDGFSVYQVLAVGGAVYGIAAALVLPHETVGRPDLVGGLRALWNPAAILAIQAVWLVIFLYTGRSAVTTSTVVFSLSHDRR